jgi:hypothetical protein
MSVYLFIRINLAAIYELTTYILVNCDMPPIV